jgi:hypothetical protein
MVIMVLPDREKPDQLAGFNVMKKSTVLLFGIDGVLAQTQKLADTEHFVNRVYTAMGGNNVEQKTAQFMADFYDELCPCIVHDNGSRFEFLQE